MMNIEYIDDNNYEITIRVFSDDFGKNIKALYNVDINMNDSLDILKNKAVIEKYFKKNIAVLFDNKKAEMQLISHKTNYQATWFYFKLSINKNKYKKITIKNKVMNEFYKDQTNLLIFTKNKFQKPYNMNVNDTIVSFKIQ